jgi:Flp pilus assembly protein TadG
MQRSKESCAGHSESGNISLFFAVGLVGLLGLMALAIDTGLGYASRGQAQSAVDGVALAAAANMIDQEEAAVTLDAANAAADDVAARNFAVPAEGLSIDPNDLTYGSWDPDERSFETAVDLDDPDQVTGVQAIVRLDDVNNPAVRPILGRVLGIDRLVVQAAATAYLGYARNVGPGDVDLPLVVPCCELTGSSCDQPYCDGSAPLPNPCPLQTNPQQGIGLVSCLRFQNSGNQTACWTEFDGEQRNVNTSDLVDIVNDNYQGELSIDDSIYLDNGTKTSAVQAIFDRFNGEGAFSGNPAGVDRHPPDNEKVDSWIVSFPVVECQNSDHCAAGDSADVVGFVCFEVMEVNVSPDRIVRGRFLCPELHPQEFETCLDGLGPTGTGGANFAIRADLPVLVR